MAVRIRADRAVAAGAAEEDRKDRGANRAEAVVEVAVAVRIRADLAAVAAVRIRADLAAARNDHDDDAPVNRL